MVIIIQNPMTACRGITCPTLVPTRQRGDGSTRTLELGRGGTLELRARPELDPDGDGVFHTDVYGRTLLPADDPHAVRQFVRPGLALQLPTGVHATQDSFGMGYRATPYAVNVELQDALRMPN